MSNPGNSGQRYKLATVNDCQREGNTTITTLSCGHDIRIDHETYEDAMWHMEYEHQRTGRRQRCMKCQKEAQ